MATKNIGNYADPQLPLGDDDLIAGAQYTTSGVGTDVKIKKKDLLAGLLGYEGIYSLTVTYIKGDVVYYLGSAYACVAQTTQGVIPGTNSNIWSLFVSKGDPGVLTTEYQTILNQAIATWNGAVDQTGQNVITATAQANSATTSATTASNAASTLQQALASFRAAYIGSLPSDPSADGNGNPLVTGAEYFNTTESKLRVWTGTQWEDYDESVQTLTQNATLSAAAAASSATTALNASNAAGVNASNAAASATASAASAASVSGQSDSSAASAAAALASANNASASQSAAAGSASNAAASATAAANSIAQGMQASANATASANSASASVLAAAASATSAQTFANNAGNSAVGAAGSAATAVATANNALTVANGIAGTANTASANATTALNAATLALPKSGGIISGTLAVTGGLAASPAANDSSTQIASTATVDSKIALVNGLAGAAGNRNAIVDGMFDNWIATSATLGTTIAYSPAIMFLDSAGAGGAATVSRVNLSGTELSGMTTPARFLYRHAQTTASTGTITAGTAPFLATRLESVDTFAGRSCTYGIWLRTASGTANITALTFTQVFGFGGSPSPTVYTTLAVNWQITTTLQFFSVRVDLPSVAGKTLGTSGDYLQVGMWWPAGVSTVDVGQMQLEPCSTTAPITGNPTPFEYRGVGAEGARTSRYYNTNLSWRLVAYAVSAHEISSPVSFPYMRAVPAATVLNVNQVTNMSSYSMSPQSFATGRIQGVTSGAGVSCIDLTVSLDARL